MMRLWHFDRLQISGSCSFDVNKDGYQFVRAILGYIMMDDEQLSFDPTIKKYKGEAFFKIDRNGHSE